MANARQVALKILYSVEFEGAYSNLAIKSGLKTAGLNAKDRGLVTSIVYGVISRKLALDKIISKYSSVKLNKLSKYVLLILRMGVYQLKFMDKIPESAAVNESVKLAMKFAARSKGFVNGVLRSVAREDFKFSNAFEELSYPEKLYKKFCEDFGTDKALRIMEALNSSPKMTVRANSLKITRNELKERLKEKGIFSEEDSLYDKNLKVSSLDIGSSEEFLKGLFTVQDTAATLSAYILAPKSGDKVLDLCAAPGGKTTHLAELMENKGEILAFDIYEHKVELIKETAKRLGIDIINAECADSCELNRELINKFDCVLADVPCSGLGIIRRKPEIKYNTEFGKELYAIQDKILSCAAEYVKPGGFLVYSTCTLNKYENELKIEKFLEENKNFESVDISDKIESETAKDGYALLLPDEYDTDGFFIAKLRRKREID